MNFQTDNEDLAERQRAALIKFMEDNDLNPKSWSDKVPMSVNTLYSFLNRKSKTMTYRTLERLASAVGRTVNEVLGAESISFTPPAKLAIAGINPYSDNSWGTLSGTKETTARPGDMVNPKAFAIRAPDMTVAPAGILNGDICIFEPGVELVSGDVVFIQRTDGLASIKRLKAFKLGAVVLEGWLHPDADDRQKIYTEEIEQSNIQLIAPVIYIRRK